jgi:hypothetical protein
MLTQFESISPTSKGLMKIYYYYYYLTAIGLMPSGSVTKIGRTYKKWTHIARKKTYNSRKNSISQKISQYSTSATNRIQDTINRMHNT